MNLQNTRRQLLQDGHTHEEIDELLDDAQQAEYRRQPTDFRLWDHDTLARFAKEVHEELMKRKEK